MASQTETNLSSVFDGMLIHSRKQFDDLYRGSHGGIGGLGKSAAAMFEGEKVAPTIQRPPSSADSKDDSPAVRRLRERFGSDWHYDVSERHRDGDEAIVLGRLTFGKGGAVRTQFGRAKIPGLPVAGASGGVQFRVGEGSSARDEQDAYRRAAEAALASCVELI
jgi:hypothetical protein